MVTKDQMNEVLRQLAAIYPAWQQAIKTQDQADNLKRVWWDEFNRLGMEPDDLKRGVIKARSSDSAFLPSLGQFIGWCRESNNPTPEQAWHHIMTRSRDDQWLNGAIVEAVRRAGGSFYLKNGNDRYTRKLFTDHYQDVLSEQAQGAKFDLPSLPAPETEESGKLADPDTAREYLDNARKAIQDSLNGQ